MLGMENRCPENSCAGTLTYFWLRKDGKRTIYHPGFATFWMMFLPAGVYIVAHLENVTGSDWLWAIILFIIMMLICIVLTETPLKKWVYKQDQGLAQMAKGLGFSV